MAEPVIVARGLHKEFHINVHEGSIKRLLLTGGQRKRRTVHALRGLDLTIHAGEAVALIGRNGSGKSTFLSLVARIYLPSAGSLEVRARVAPLLELGAGFHHDLTGWENLELNGMILGLSRRQIAERAASIIEFSELQDSISASLRTYSSGMVVRLGFAIAVHTDAEILVVDEALAVGDEAFQEKCFDKIEELKRQGRTILFVSHEMTDVTRVATRAIWMEKGLVRLDGPPERVVEQYLEESHHPQHTPAGGVLEP